MTSNKKIRELEKMLKELKSEEQSATVLDSPESLYYRKDRKKGFIRKFLIPKFFMQWYVWATIIVLALLIIIPIATMNLIKGSTFTENKGSIMERIQNLNELTTAEAYTKIMIERSDNKLFGKEIGVNLPGTKRELLVVIPGGVKAGVDFSKITEKDIELNEEKKIATITLPTAKILGEPQIDFDHVQVFSSEGLFREKADISEAYELAKEAKKLMIEEATTQGVIDTAKSNAQSSVADMFALVGYDVTVEFKE
ncbi:DUF4230 domain-containing protein [Viridibacillus arvi]|nr:DUF4230 domain-containing protein [Viridibacillus arvi]